MFRFFFSSNVRSVDGAEPRQQLVSIRAGKKLRKISTFFWHCKIVNPRAHSPCCTGLDARYLHFTSSNHLVGELLAVSCNSVFSRWPQLPPIFSGAARVCLCVCVSVCAYLCVHFSCSHVAIFLFRWFPPFLLNNLTFIFLQFHNEIFTHCNVIRCILCSAQGSLKFLHKLQI